MTKDPCSRCGWPFSKSGEEWMCFTIRVPKPFGDAYLSRPICLACANEYYDRAVAWLEGEQ